MQPLDGRPDLFTNRRSQDGVSSIEAFGRDHPPRDIIRAQQLARCGSENAKAEPRQFISREVPIAAVSALRSKRVGIKFSRQHAEHAVNVRQIGSVLIKLALQLIDDAGQFAALLDQPGNDMILARDHAALRCQ